MIEEDLKNQRLSEIISRVVYIMNKNNCRSEDVYILRALNNTTYNIVNGEIEIFLDCSVLPKW